MEIMLRSKLLLTVVVRGTLSNRHKAVDVTTPRTKRILAAGLPARLRTFYLGFLANRLRPCFRLSGCTTTHSKISVVSVWEQN